MVRVKLPFHIRLNMRSNVELTPQIFYIISHYKSNVNSEVTQWRMSRILYPLRQ
nr:MAG TPA: hypothetical protein [Caudoviricetes sp.]